MLNVLNLFSGLGGFTLDLSAQLMTFKRGTFTDKEIVDKAVSLAPVMQQQTEAGLMEELHLFRSVDPIWRWGNFGCYAAIK